MVVGKEHVPLEGPVILAPVHRSFADFAFSAFLTRRKLFFMTKDDLWANRPLGKLLTALSLWWFATPLITFASTFVSVISAAPSAIFFTRPMSRVSSGNSRARMR